MTKHCPKCGARAVDEQSLFCNKCGTQLPVSIPEKKSELFCPKCKAEITDKNSSVCTQCNFPLYEKTVLVKPVRPVKICPNCNEPVFDENRYYCKKCGAYIHDTKSGISLEKSTVKQMGKKPVIIPGIYQNTQTTKIERQEPAGIKKPGIPIKPKMKLPKVNPIIVLVIIAGLLILAWATVSLSGPGNSIIAGGNVGNNLPSDNDLLISQDLSSMALTIDDFPQGWIVRSGGDTENEYFAQFEKTSEENPGLVKMNIKKYASTDAARQQFITLRAQTSSVDIETINLGNEGFGFIELDYAVVIFRKDNIIFTLEDIRSEYQFDATINNAKNYAQIVANRIR